LIKNEKKPPKVLYKIKNLAIQLFSYSAIQLFSYSAIKNYLKERFIEKIHEFIKKNTRLVFTKISHIL
jgi:hypothetical protein